MYSDEKINSFSLFSDNNQFSTHISSINTVTDISTTGNKLKRSPTGVDGLVNSENSSETSHSTAIISEKAKESLENPDIKSDVQNRSLLRPNASEFLPRSTDVAISTIESSELKEQRARAQYQLLLYQKMLEKEELAKRSTVPLAPHKVSEQALNNFTLPLQQPPSRMNPLMTTGLATDFNMGMNRRMNILPPPIVTSQRLFNNALSTSEYNRLASPTSMSPTAAGGNIYQVQFKTACRFFVLGSQLLSPIAVHDFVVVEADRGEDLGVVRGVLTMQEFMEKRHHMRGLDNTNSQVRRILRSATMAERQTLAEKHKDEEAVVQFSNQLAQSVHQLPVMVYDAEFQFDRHKLTIYYNCNCRIDFRELVRDLFAAYKARIWMEKLNPLELIGDRRQDLDQAASIALATGVQFAFQESVSGLFK